MKNILKKQFSYLQIYFLVVFVVAIRVMAEWAVFVFPIQLDVFQDYVRFFLENTYYFLIVFTVSAVFASKFIKKDLREVMNFGVRFYPVIILPPLIDGLLLGRTAGYDYANVSNLVGNFFTLFSFKGDATMGIFLEIVIALSGVSIYVYKHTKSIFKSVVMFLVIDFVLLIISTPDLFFGAFRGDYFFDYFLPFFYYLPFLVILSVVLSSYDRNKLRSIISNIRVIRSLIFIFAVIAGGLVRNILLGELYALNVFYGASAIFLVWQVSILINDISDIKIDMISNRLRPLVKGDVTVQEYKLLAVLLSFVALSFAIIISLKVFLYVLIGIALSYVYSVKPFRFRNNILGNIVIGLYLLISFWVGVEAADSSVSFKKISYVFDLGFLSAIIFLFGMVISMVKDVKDVDADKEYGVINVFTIFGKEKGKLLMSVIVFLVFNIPTLLSGSFHFLILSSVAAVSYYVFESINAVYLLGVVIFYYTIFFPG